MSIKKFGENDLLVNTMKAHPKSEFFIFDSITYYNNRNQQSGAFSHNVRNVGPGHISLYEYNIDKGTGSYGSRLSTGGGINGFIYPFLVKSSDRAIFRSTFTGGQLDDWRALEPGTEFYGNYPMSASISREFWTGSYSVTDGKCGQYAAQKTPLYNEAVGTATTHPLVTRTEFRDNTEVECATGTPYHRHYYAIRSKLDFYKTRSEHYAVSSSLSPYTSGEGVNEGWNKDLQEINAIMVPSIFYGSEIKPGTVSLKMYVTGTQIGELQDFKQNGELIQVSGALDQDWKAGSGSVAGVVMYQEGIMLLTGNWAVGAQEVAIRLNASDTTDYPKWKYFGAGCEDGITTDSVGGSFVSMSFDLSFRGTTETQVMTMYARAPKGMVNHSNNPTFIEYGQTKLARTSSAVYQENATLRIKNTVSSSFEGHSASFNRQVYISRVGIYDSKKKLIGIATLANPVLKKQEDDITFKIKLDI